MLTNKLVLIKVNFVSVVEMSNTVLSVSTVETLHGLLSTQPGKQELLVSFTTPPTTNLSEQTLW